MQEWLGTKRCGCVAQALSDEGVVLQVLSFTVSKKKQLVFPLWCYSALVESFNRVLLSEQLPGVQLPPVHTQQFSANGRGGATSPSRLDQRTQGWPSNKALCGGYWRNTAHGFQTAGSATFG
ncbi:unnamed protein product [Effrenium voratum]|nr:unnamed protein product [Effrenium voratum]